MTSVFRQLTFMKLESKFLEKSYENKALILKEKSPNGT